MSNLHSKCWRQPSANRDSTTKDSTNRFEHALVLFGRADRKSDGGAGKRYAHVLGISNKHTGLLASLDKRSRIVPTFFGEVGQQVVGDTGKDPEA